MSGFEDLYQNGVRHRDGSSGFALCRMRAGNCFKEAAERGHPAATAWIALLSKGTITGYDEDPIAYKKWADGITTTKAVEYFLGRSESGDLDAAYSLGVLYEEGLGVPLDYEESLKWYLKAASNGFPPAQNNYALMLKRGLGIPMNDEETVRWYKKAAKQDYVISQNNLGYMYKTGKGVPADITKAFHWFHRAADIGYASAQKNVGDMYRTGQGVERDFELAEKYYLQAANQQHSVAMNSLGVLYQQSAADWVTDHHKAFEWYSKACINSVAASEYNLYLMYLEKLVPGSDKMSDDESVARALAHLSRSVNHSNPSILGMLAYALRLLKGRGILRNKIEGVKWMMNVCMCGLSEALEELERVYLGQREFLFFGVLELEPDSAFPFVTLASRSVRMLIAGKKSEMIQEFRFLPRIELSKKLLILKALLPELEVQHSGSLAKTIYSDMIALIRDELTCIDRYAPCGPALVDSFRIRPFFEVSVAKVAFQILRHVTLAKQKKDLPSKEPIDRKKHYEETLSITELKEQDRTFVAFLLDDCDYPVYAHRGFLIEHHYFSVLLEGNMKESSQDVIRIHQVSKTTFELYLKFLYGLDIIPFIEGDTLMEAIATAHYLTWNDFHDNLCRALENILDWDQFSLVYNNAKSFSDAILVRVCHSFAMNHFDELLDTRKRQTRIIHVEKEVLEQVTENLLARIHSVFQDIPCDGYFPEPPVSQAAYPIPDPDDV